MKMSKILQTVTLLSILVLLISCRSSRSTSGRQYPRSYPSSPTPESPTKTYPVYESTSNPANLPPGQAKKVYGSKSAKAYAPGQRKKFGYPLIIIRTPDIVVTRYNDGRYYYRNADGIMYWKGNDGRYYVDEKHLKGMEYEQGDYDDWKDKGQKNNKGQLAKGKEQEEKAKDDQKTKDAEQKGNGQDQRVKDKEDQKAKGDEQKGNGQDQKGKDKQDQKSKGDEQKGKGQDQKAKNENAEKGKAKSKDKA